MQACPSRPPPPLPSHTTLSCNQTFFRFVPDSEVPLHSLLCCVWRPSARVHSDVVLFHDMTLSLDHPSTQQLAELLMSLNCNVWGLEFAGHGRSTGKRGLSSDHAQFVTDAVAFAKYVDRTTFHSSSTQPSSTVSLSSNPLPSSPTPTPAGTTTPSSPSLQRGTTTSSSTTTTTTTALKSVAASSITISTSTSPFATSTKTTTTKTAATTTTRNTTTTTTTTTTTAAVSGSRGQFSQSQQQQQQQQSQSHGSAGGLQLVLPSLAPPSTIFIAGEGVGGALAVLVASSMQRTNFFDRVRGVILIGASLDPGVPLTNTCCCECWWSCLACGCASASCCGPVLPLVTETSSRPVVTEEPGVDRLLVGTRRCMMETMAAARMEMARLRIPVLALHGRSDHYAPHAVVDTLVNQVQSASKRFVSVPAKHFILFDSASADKVQASLRVWVNSLVAQPVNLTPTPAVVCFHRCFKGHCGVCVVDGQRCVAVPVGQRVVCCHRAFAAHCGVCVLDGSSCKLATDPEFFIPAKPH